MMVSLKSARIVFCFALPALVGCSLLVEQKLDDKPGALPGEFLPDASESDGDVGPHEGDDGAVPPDARDGGLADAEKPLDDAGHGDDDDGGQPAMGDAGPEFDRTQVRISIGVQHACGLFPDGSFKCWGENDENQRNVPPGTYIDLACGDYHTCVIDAAGALTCVGRNRDGQRVSKPGPYTRVAAGDGHTCAMDEDGKVECWGNNDEGQSTAPDVAFTSIAAGGAFSCGIRKADRKVECWGSDSGNRASPPAGVAFVSIDAGRAHGCGRTSEGSAKCWGEIMFDAPPLVDVSQVAAGNYVSCALLADGTGRCWPYESVPESQKGPFVALSAGPNAVCFTPASGNLACYLSGALSEPPGDFFAQQ